MNRIYVDLETLEMSYRQMEEQIETYRVLYGQLFEKIDETGTFWSGKDQQAFVNQIHGFEDDFAKMYQVVSAYCQFLKKSVQAYRATQDEAQNAAGRLVQ